METVVPKIVHQKMAPVSGNDALLLQMHLVLSVGDSVTLAPEGRRQR